MKPEILEKPENPTQNFRVTECPPRQCGRSFPARLHEEDMKATNKTIIHQRFCLAKGKQSVTSYPNASHMIGMKIRAQTQLIIHGVFDA